MPSGLWARVVAVCTLILGVSIAHADRRPVAVIDLSGEEVTENLVRELNPILVSHPDLQPVRDSQLAGDLYGEFRDDDKSNRDAANEHKEAAENDVAGFNLVLAEQNAREGEERLLQVQPGPVVIKAYSQLAFLRGLAMLGIPKQVKDAPEQFALASRLDPTFVPNAARYLPDVVQAYNDAKKRWTGKGTLVVAGHGLLWIDGREEGNLPIEAEVTAGPHVVWATGTDRKSSGTTVMVDADTKKTLEIPDAPADTRLKLRRARAALRNAPDTAARAAAMQQIANLVGVRDALILIAANNKVIYQWWNSGTLDQPGFSSLREVANKKPIELLAGLAPPKPKIEPPKVEKEKPIVDERRWYQRRPVQVSIGVGIVAAIIGGYYIYKAATDDTVTWDNDIVNAGRIRW